MAAQKGLDLQLAVEDTPASGTYTIIAGATTNNLSINNETVDVTNKSSSRFRQLLEGAGVTSISTNVSGVYTAAATEEQLRVAAQTNASLNYEITIPDGGSNKTYTGAFQISSYENAGEYNGAVSFTATLESAGDITIT
mgnify:CR=1 FL=1